MSATSVTSDGNGRTTSVKVLIVEDNPDHAALIRRAMMTIPHWGAAVVATTPHDAQRLIDEPEAHFDLLVVDFSLPGMTGLELIRQLRRQGMDVPTILITGMGAEEVVAEALRLGVSDYVSKGERFWHLLPVVALRVLERTRTARRLRSLDSLMLGVSECRTPDAMAARIAKSARLLLDGDGAAVWASTNEPAVFADGPRGEALRLLGNEVLFDDASPVLDLASDGHVTIVRQLRTETSQPIGLLAVSREGPQEVLPEEERVLSVFARFAGTALENVSRFVREQDRAQRLEDLDRIKSEFISTVSHELLTPLTVVEGFAETLLDRWEALSDCDRRAYVERQLTHAQDLSSLVHRVLEFSRLEQIAPPEPQESRISDALSAVEFPGQSRIVVRLSAERAYVAADSLRSILANLISNALKYSPTGEAVEVLAYPEGRDVVIAVQDRGPGVPADERVAIFEPFVRGREAPSARGTGIGLAIVARHVAAAGGSVWVEPREGGGCAFKVRLPSGAPVGAAPALALGSAHRRPDVVAAVKD